MVEPAELFRSKFELQIMQSILLIPWMHQFECHTMNTEANSVWARNFQVGSSLEKLSKSLIWIKWTNFNEKERLIGRLHRDQWRSLLVDLFDHSFQSNKSHPHGNCPPLNDRVGTATEMENGEILTDFILKRYLIS